MASSNTDLRWGWVALACLGCKHEPGGPTDVASEVSARISTVITVRWTTDEPTSGAVSFGVDGALDRTTPSTPSATDHEVVLVGLPADRDVSWAIVSDGETTDVHTDHTGPLPAGLVPPTVTGDGNDRWLLTTLVGEPNTVVLFDPSGEPTWWYDDPRGLSVFRARITRDGEGIVYSSAIVDGGPSPDSALVRVSWDGERVEELPVPDLAHDFVELPDGTLASLRYETRDDVLGSGVVEVSRDGTVTPTWSAWDCLDPTANPSDDPAHGWTHANALDYQADRDRYLVGLRNLGTLIAVDRATGDCPWAFGGSGGDVDVNGATFLHQHQFEQIDGGMLVFDNDGAVGNASRVVEYTFDEAAGTAEELRVFSADPPLYSFIMGDTDRLPDGDTFALFSVPGVIERFDPEGASTWRLELGGDDLLGFLQHLSDPYTLP
ncbi:MAG: aryl-sulfate sulfotransferase [Myxococcota bacterium]